MPYKNPEDQKAYVRKHYERNKAAYVKRAVAHKKKVADLIRDYIIEYLKDNPCVDCGEDDPIVLEFDHVSDDKSFNIGSYRAESRTMKSVKAEIEKCEVRCCNCHRRMTYKRSGWTHKG